MKIICVGKIKDRSIDALMHEYAKRTKIDIIEIKDSDSGSEGKRLIEKFSAIRNPCIIALSEEGTPYSSIDFAEYIKKIISLGNEPVFIIGGPDGLSSEVKKRANKLLSLSKMTFTHEMARLFLVEQLYRAETILKNKKYHR